MFVIPKPNTERCMSYRAGIRNAARVGKFHHLNSLLPLSRTLMEPRQAEIRKECLQLWGVSKLPSREVVKVSCCGETRMELQYR